MSSEANTRRPRPYPLAAKIAAFNRRDLPIEAAKCGGAIALTIEARRATQGKLRDVEDHKTEKNLFSHLRHTHC